MLPDRRVAGTLRVREFETGQVAFRDGDSAAGVWIVRDGRIELSLGSGRRRAVVHLLRPGDVDGDIQLLVEEAEDGRVELPQRTLAAMLGVQRPSLNKVLKDLEREGLITIGYSAIDITDPAGLAKYAR